MPLKLMCSEGDSILLEGSGVPEEIRIEILFTGENRCQLSIQAPRETVEIHHRRTTRATPHRFRKDK